MPRGRTKTGLTRLLLGRVQVDSCSKHDLSRVVVGEWVNVCQWINAAAEQFAGTRSKSAVDSVVVSLRRLATIGHATKSPATSFCAIAMTVPIVTATTVHDEPNAAPKASLPRMDGAVPILGEHRRSPPRCCRSEINHPDPPIARRTG